MNSDFSIAAHALVFLNHKQTALTSDELAENICTNSARVRKALAPLKRAGMLVAKEGAKGGYALAAEAETITLQDVADALGTRFVEAGWKSGDADMECLIASGMAGIMDGICADLDAVCKERLARTTVADIDRTIFPE